MLDPITMLHTQQLVQQTKPSIQRIAVINRGEAAVRFLKTIALFPKIDAVLFYTQSDEQTAFVRAFEHKICIGEDKWAYSQADVVLKAIAQMKCEAAWLGWGFASEDGDFAQALEEAGVILLAPTADSLRRLGDKAKARALALELGLPLNQGDDIDFSLYPDITAQKQACQKRLQKLSYPFLFKAVDGGGGRGILLVEHEGQLEDKIQEALQQASRQGFRPCFVMEAYWEKARHLEVQILGDGQGAVLALGVRDCSVQRRRQKVIEEAFAHEESFLKQAHRRLLEQAAIRLGSHVHYRSAGTVEFLYEPSSGQISFLEVNPRLQVEHTVTEEIFDIDLVECQIKLALGLGLPVLKEARGWAIEARVYAEDPENDFRPSPGRLLRFKPALGAKLRVDTGFEEGDLISADFDPLIAKIIAYGNDRDSAIQRLKYALTHTQILIMGGVSNLELLRSICDEPDYLAGNWQIYTPMPQLRHQQQGEKAYAVLAYALDDFLRRADLSEQSEQRLNYEGELRLSIYHHAPCQFLIIPATQQAQATAELSQGLFVEYQPIDHVQSMLKLQHQSFKIQRLIGDQRYFVNGKPYQIQGKQNNLMLAPSMGVVLGILKAVGQRVIKGEKLFLIESMKVEVSITAHQDGLLKGIFCRVGDLLRAGQTMALIEAEGQEEQQSLSLPYVPLALKQADQQAQWESMIYHGMTGWDMPISWIEERAQHIMDFSTQTKQRLVSAFLDIALLFDKRPLINQEDENGLAYATRPILLMDTLEQRGESALPEAWKQRLKSALKHYHIENLIPTKDLHEALIRLKRASLSLPQLANIAFLALQGIEKPELKLLEGFYELDEDKYWQMIELADEKRLGLLSSQLHSQQQRLMIPKAHIQALLSRFERFTVEPILDPLLEQDQLYFYWLTAKENAEDKRLFAYAQINDIHRRPGRPFCIPEVELVFLRSIRMIQKILRIHDPTRKLQWNRLVLHITPIVPIGIEVVKSYVNQLLPAVRRMGLEKIVIQAKFKDGLAPTPSLLDISIFNLLHDRPNFAIRPASDQPLTPRTRYESQVVVARRRGLIHPDEVIHLLEGLGPFPAGKFEAYEWDETAQGLVRIQREAGENPSAIVLGLITTTLHRPYRSIKRAIMISDATKSMGALTKEECLRISALLAMAEEQKLPVEWITVSGGAKIDWETGTENLDWCASVLQKIIDFRNRGGEINIIVNGVCVGAQSYWNAEATMMMNSKGVLVMTDRGSMVLTGKKALDFSGCVSAEDELDLGGYAAIMGPNGQAQLHSTDLPKAYKLLYRYYELSYCQPFEAQVRPVQTRDQRERNIGDFPYPKDLLHGFEKIADLFSEQNAERKRPFAVRVMMQALIDQDLNYLERWGAMQGAETAVVWHSRIGGYAVTLIGIDNQNYQRLGHIEQGPNTWAGGTLYPQASKKIARAIYASQDKNPVVILANLSGFDGSPESLRNWQLEYGAAIGEAVVNFKGHIIFVVLSRYHGGAYVVFSKALNPKLQSIALEGSYASVIGGTPAAGVIFQREVQQLAKQKGSYDLALKEVAQRFDQIHDIERAKRVGSIDEIIGLSELRPRLIDKLAGIYQSEST